MPFLLALVAIAAGLYFWTLRARNAAEAARELGDMAADVMSAARRFGFRRRANIHPVDSIDDASVAMGALTVALAELGPPPSDASRKAHLIALQAELDMPLARAQELLILGHWLVNECNGPDPAIARMGKRVRSLAADDGLDGVLRIFKPVAEASAGLSEAQRDALADLARLFGRK